MAFKQFAGHALDCSGLSPLWVTPPDSVEPLTSAHFLLDHTFNEQVLNQEGTLFAG